MLDGRLFLNVKVLIVCWLFGVLCVCRCLGSIVLLLGLLIMIVYLIFNCLGIVKLVCVRLKLMFVILCVVNLSCVVCNVSDIYVVLVLKLWLCDGFDLLLVFGGVRLLDRYSRIIDVFFV